MELTGRFYHMVPLGIVTLFAYAAGELLRDRPIFDAILEDDLKVRFPKTAKKDQLQRNPYVYEAAVESGSLAEGKSLKELKFPAKPWWFPCGVVTVPSSPTPALCLCQVIIFTFSLTRHGSQT